MKTTIRMSCLLFLVLVKLVSCKKDGGPPPGTSGTPSLMVASRTTGTLQEVYTYDNNGRVILVNDGNGKKKITYTYSSGLVTRNRYDTDGVTLLNVESDTLNADGLAVKVAPNLTAYPLWFNIIEYNPDKTPAKYFNYNNGIDLFFATYSSYSGGNLIKDSVVLYPGLSKNTREIEYYTDISSTTENTNMGLLYFGIGSKNAVKKISYYTNGVLQQVHNYMQPELDANKRIIKTGYQVNGAGTYTYTTYTYK
jgi:hypothetical protein